MITTHDLTVQKVSAIKNFTIGKKGRTTKPLKKAPPKVKKTCQEIPAGLPRE